jgi:hypothetical protein
MPAVRRSETCFRAQFDGSEKGRVFLVIPFDPAEQWGERTRYTVGGTINGQSFRGTIEKVGTRYILPVGPAWRRDCGIRVGEEVGLVLGIEGPQRQDLAPDVAAALEAEPEAGDFFDSMAQFYRKGYLRWIDATKRRPDVRAERIAEMIRLLKAGQKRWPGS